MGAKLVEKILMGNLTNQMEALVQGILTSTRARKAFDRERVMAAKAWKTAVSADCQARAADVRKMRLGFRRAHDQMARELAHNLTGFVRGIRVKTQDLLGRFREDVQGAHQVWKNFLCAQTGVAAQESSPGRSRRAEKSEDEEKVLRIIQDRPAGISISRIAEAVGLPASLVGRIATELVERRKVRKNGASRLYFPIEREAIHITAAGA